MTLPKAYEPQQGYMYHILCRHPQYNGREWEHCDYAKDFTEKKYLLGEYRMAYDPAYEFKCIMQPAKYWHGG